MRHVLAPDRSYDKPRTPGSIRGEEPQGALGGERVMCPCLEELNFAGLSCYDQRSMHPQVYRVTFTHFDLFICPRILIQDASMCMM